MYGSGDARVRDGIGVVVGDQLIRDRTDAWLLQRFFGVQLPGDLGYVGHTWVLIAAGVLFTVQFIADKIPAVDSAWDMVHTFIRVPAGAVLAATAFAHFPPEIRVVALLLGGGVALSSHGTKTATRLAANASPEPVSNIVLSLIGDAVAFGGTLLMTFHPAVLVFIVAVAVVISIIILRWILQWLRRLFGGDRKVAAVRS